VLVAGKRNQTRLPVLSLLAGAVIAIFPSLLVINLKRREAQQQAEAQQRQEEDRARRIADLKQLLDTPAETLEPASKNGHVSADLADQSNVEILVS
jgi:hypothetical protein